MGPEVGKHEKEISESRGFFFLFGVTQSHLKSVFMNCLWYIMIPGKFPGFGLFFFLIFPAAFLIHLAVPSNCVRHRVQHFMAVICKRILSFHRVRIFPFQLSSEYIQLLEWAAFWMTGDCWLVFNFYCSHSALLSWEWYIVREVRALTAACWNHQEKEVQWVNVLPPRLNLYSFFQFSLSFFQRQLWDIFPRLLYK